MRMIVWICSIILLTCIGCSSENITERDCHISISYLWSMVRGGTTQIKEDYVLRGFVSANDYLGETYRSVIISDDSSGVEIKIDMEDIYRFLPLGHSIEVYCSGLYVGREGDALIMGKNPTSDFAVDRIPAEELYNYISIGENIAPQAEEISIENIGRDDIFRYVMIKDVKIIDAERGCKWCDKDANTGEFATTLRHFTDGTYVIHIVTAPTADYHNEEVPSWCVNCIGVVDTYGGEVVLRLSNYQIVPAE